MLRVSPPVSERDKKIHPSQHDPSRDQWPETVCLHGEYVDELAAANTMAMITNICRAIPI